MSISNSNISNVININGSNRTKINNIRQSLLKSSLEDVNKNSKKSNTKINGQSIKEFITIQDQKNNNFVEENYFYCQDSNNKGVKEIKYTPNENKINTRDTKNNISHSFLIEKEQKEKISKKSFNNPYNFEQLNSSLNLNNLSFSNLSQSNFSTLSFSNNSFNSLSFYSNRQKTKEDLEDASHDYLIGLAKMFKKC